MVFGVSRTPLKPGGFGLLPQMSVERQRVDN